MSDLPPLKYTPMYTKEKCAACMVLIGTITDITYDGISVTLEGSYSKFCTICHKIVHAHCGRVVKTFFTCHACCETLVCNCDLCGLLRAQRLGRLFEQSAKQGKCQDYLVERKQHHN